MARRDFPLIFDAEVPSYYTGIFATEPTAFGAAFFQQHPGPSLCEQKDMIPIAGARLGRSSFVRNYILHSGETLQYGHRLLRVLGKRPVEVFNGRLDQEEIFALPGHTDDLHYFVLVTF